MKYQCKMLVSMTVGAAAHRLICCRHLIGIYTQPIFRVISTGVTSQASRYPMETVSAILTFSQQNSKMFGKIVSASEPKKRKKRGRPRKGEDSIGEINLGPRRKPGRPKKTKEVTEEIDLNMPKKRGRPKKIKEAHVETETKTLEKHGTIKRLDNSSLEQILHPAVGLETGDVSDKKLNVELVSEKGMNNAEVNTSEVLLDQSEYIAKHRSKHVESPGLEIGLENSTGKETEEINSKTDKANDQSKLGVIVSFPFFPPSRTEYFVRPIKQPDVYIPMYTERSGWENPYFPSVGAILNQTQSPESKMMLQKWKDDLIKKLGEEGFQQFQKAIFARGTDFHEAIEKYMKGTPVSNIHMASGNEGYWQSAWSVVKDITDVQAIEESVIHRDLCYKGIFDCIASYRDQRVMIEWKTSKKAKADIRYTYDNPLQVAAYTGAYNLMPEHETMIEKAMIVVCYEDGKPAHTHIMSRSMCIDYWGQWLKRLHMYWIEKISSV